MGSSGALFSLSPSSHFPPGCQGQRLRQSRPLQRPLALGSHSGRCPWLQHPQARHVRRPRRGLRLAQAPSPSPSTPPPGPGLSSRPAGACGPASGARPGASGGTPTSLLGKGLVSRGGGAARGWGWEPRDATAPGAATAASERPGSRRSLRHRRLPRGDPRLSSGRGLPSHPSGHPWSKPHHDMEEFLQCAKSKLVS